MNKSKFRNYVLLCAGFLFFNNSFSGMNSPSGTSGLVSFSNGTRYVFNVNDFGFSDPEDSPPDEFYSLIVTTVPDDGVLMLNGSAVVAGQIIFADDILDRKFSFNLNSSATENLDADFTFQVQDSGSGNQNEVSFISNIRELSNSLNSTGRMIAPIRTSVYQNLAVEGGLDSGSNSWGVWSPPVASVTTSIFNAPVTFPTPYLDQSGFGSERNTTWTFTNNGVPVSAAELSSGSNVYTYIFGIAGLGNFDASRPEYTEITSSVPLKVVANGDEFGNGNYSYLDGRDTSIVNNPDALGMVGTVISTNPNQEGDGYTFFALPGDASSFSLVEDGSDAHGIVFGIVETTLSNTLDLFPKRMSIKYIAPTPVPMGFSWLVVLMISFVFFVLHYRGHLRGRLFHS